MAAGLTRTSLPCLHVQVPTEQDSRSLRIVHVTAELAPIGKVSAASDCMPGAFTPVALTSTPTLKYLLITRAYKHHTLIHSLAHSLTHTD